MGGGRTGGAGSLVLAQRGYEARFARHPRLSGQHFWPRWPSGATLNSFIHRHHPAERRERRGGEINECKPMLLLHTCQLVGTLQASKGKHFSTVTQFCSLKAQSR